MSQTANTTGPSGSLLIMALAPPKLVTEKMLFIKDYEDDGGKATAAPHRLGNAVNARRAGVKMHDLLS